MFLRVPHDAEPGWLDGDDGESESMAFHHS